MGCLLQQQLFNIYNIFAREIKSQIYKETIRLLRFR